MGYESGSTSHDGHDEDDDEEEYEEDGGRNGLLGFMFGNVDNSGDLDIDYLDQDAKEHIGALADQLGPSLTDIHLSVKSSQASADAAEEDYDEKAEDAVDYEDIDEQYEGPETQAVTEEDYLLPKNKYFPTEASAPTVNVFDDDDYDEDDDDVAAAEELKKELQQVVIDDDSDLQTSSPPGEDGYTVAVLEGSNEDGTTVGASKPENLVPEVEEFQKDEDPNSTSEEELVCETPQLQLQPPPLPVLCVEDGMVILRFSEIFGIHEPLKKAEKRDHKYSVAKEKYKSFNASEIVEDDEEAFLKGIPPGFVLRKSNVVQDELLEFKDDEELESVQKNEEKKVECNYNSAEPMKADASFGQSTEWTPPSLPEIYPLDQQDWEDQIIWDNSSSYSQNAAESSEISGPGSVEDFMEQESHPTDQIESNEKEKDHGIFLRNFTVSVESLGSREFERPEGGYYHPQLLRLESETNGLDHSDAIRRFSKLNLQNKDILEGSWLDKIIWDPNDQSAAPRSKLIFDLQDEQMLFEIIDNDDDDDKEGQDLQVHAGAMIITRSVKSNGGDSVEVHNNHAGGPSGGRFNIANDKYYSNRKSSQQLKSHSKKRTAHGVKVLHSIPALKLQTMKAKLSNKDIANFHRLKALWYPHDNEVALKTQGELPTQGPMKIIVKSLGGKGSKLHVDSEETISSVKAKASKKLDFKPTEPVKIFYSGKELEENKSLAVQNVRPNSLLHLVRTKIHLLPRAQKLPGENKSLRPPGAFKKKSDLSVKDGHVFLMEYCEERPLFLGNAGMGARLCTYYQKSAPGDQRGATLRSGNNNLGNILTLDPADKSPFLGDIKPGCTQSCLETNMYRAPIYQHKVSTTDYLLVRSAKGKLSIRRIDRIDVVGQQEPHMEVMAPGSKSVQNYIMNRLLVYIYREFAAVEKRNLLPSIRSDELSAQFPNFVETFLRKRLKHCCYLQRGSNGQLLWVMRRNFRIPLEEELRRMVTPENVCSYESMQAGQYRLKRLGITRLINPTGLSSAMNQLPDEAIALAAASHIERELQITPWNLSSNFVSCTNQDRENIERLEITGVGDPSGRGLGFSYVRTAPKPVSNAATLNKKKAAVNRGGSTVTGTDADLRRLSMEAAREVLVKFNVPEEQIAKQTRWHRIAMIRKLSSEQAASGVKVDPTTISKYARGQRMSFTQLQQQTREKCQEIWDRQFLSLSAADGDEFESDAEAAHSDLDSFAGDLENLLDAEDFEEEDEGEDGDNYYDSKHAKHNEGGVKGLKMRRRASQVQAEEEIEDEAAEFAELRRMLMDDNEAEQRKKKKARVGGEAIKGTDNTVKKILTNPVATAVNQPDVLLAAKDNPVKEPIEMEERFSVKKNNFPGKIKTKRKNEFEQMGLLKKKVKILGDGIMIVKEKKSARESFVCGACGQLGHMRTNKNCPKYGDDSDLQGESSKDQDKASAKSASVDLTTNPQPLQPKLSGRKIIQKGSTKIAVVEATEEEKPTITNTTLKPKVLKVICGDKATPASSQLSDRPTMSDAETPNKSSSVKVNRIVFSNKIVKPDNVQSESQKPPLQPVAVPLPVPPPVVAAETDRDQPRKKITIKRPKEVDLDQISQEGSTGIEHRKMKKMAELSSFPKHGGRQFEEPATVAVKRKNRDEKRWLEEREKRRMAEREREEEEETARRRSREEQEQEKNIARYEEVIRREREEEEREKAIRKKKKKNKRTEVYYDDFPSRRPEHIPKRRPPSPTISDYGGPPLNRRRGAGGEVGLSNILGSIVETLKERYEVSYLFLKPVSKKEAPDYLDIIEHPMDLSTIKEKVRKLEYKSREEFRHDVWQITLNAHIYNDGRNPGIPPLADQLLELCDYLLSQNDPILSKAESSIEFRDA